MVGTTRDIRLAKRPQSCNVELVSLDLMNYDQVTDLIDKLRPDEVYHFAAPSSVARSFGDPVKAVTGITIAGLNLLASIRNIDERIRFLDAGSIEMFGECGMPVDESTRLSPHSPYGVGKQHSRGCTPWPGSTDETQGSAGLYIADFCTVTAKSKTSQAAQIHWYH